MLTSLTQMTRKWGRTPKLSLSHQAEAVAPEYQPSMRVPVISRPSQNIPPQEQACEFQRATREGQLVSNPKRGGRRQADTYEDGAGGEEPGTSGALNRGGVETDHEKRNRRQEEAWTAKRAEMICDAYASAPLQRAGSTAGFRSGGSSAEDDRLFLG